mgnify:CR=1 FL=1
MGSVVLLLHVDFSHGSVHTDGCGVCSIRPVPLSCEVVVERRLWSGERNWSYLT